MPLQDEAALKLMNILEYEGNTILLSILRHFKSSTYPKKILAIGDIENAVILGRLDEGVIKSVNIRRIVRDGPRLSGPLGDTYFLNGTPYHR